MAKISKQDVEHAAELARIKLTDNEISKFAAELETILGHIAELSQAPTEKIAEIAQISGLKNVSRDDFIEPGLSVEAVLRNAPVQENSFFKTKKVFE